MSIDFENDPIAQLEEMRLIADALPPESRELQLRRMWASNETPEIQSQEQYEDYKRRCIEIESRMRKAGIKPGMPEFAQSQDAIQLDALGGAMIEWENRPSKGK
jgi:hypothetical protein